jgi:hypothetical protein
MTEEYLEEVTTKTNTLDIFRNSRALNKKHNLDSYHVPCWSLLRAQNECIFRPATAASRPTRRRSTRSGPSSAAGSIEPSSSAQAVSTRPTSARLSRPPGIPAWSPSR